MTRGLAAVTGATGFLGRRLVPALVAEGWRVRVLARRPIADSFFEAGREEPPPETVLGDVADRSALEALTVGADVLFHAAGLIKARNREAFFAVNAEGARLAAESITGGAMILISSLAAREPGLSAYAASKRAGEEAARAVLGTQLTVLRPPAIYGPGDRETLALFRLAGTSPILPTPSSRSARLALAHVDDVVAQSLALAGLNRPPGVFAIGGDRPKGYAWREIFATAAIAMDRRAWLAPIPDWTITAAAGAAQGMALLRGSPAIFNRGKARELLHGDWSVAPGEQAPGPLPACIPLLAGFQSAVAWYRAQGWLPTRRD